MSRPQNSLNLILTPKTAHLEPKRKSSKPQEFGQKQKIWLDEAQKIEVFQLYDFSFLSLATV